MNKKEESIIVKLETTKMEIVKYFKMIQRQYQEFDALEKKTTLDDELQDKLDILKL